MRLSKAQKAALLFGAFSIVADQISDAWMSLDYYFNCHYTWSRTAFILTFWRLPMFGLISNLTCYQEFKDRCITTIQGIFGPFWMVYCVIQTLKSDNQNVILDRIASIKMYKLIEVVVESFWQICFNLYTRSYMDSLSAVHLASISLSFLAILNVVSDMFVCYHGRTLSPRFSEWSTSLGLKKLVEFFILKNLSLVLVFKKSKKRCVFLLFLYKNFIPHIILKWH